MNYDEKRNSGPSPALLHAFVLGPELLPSFPSVKPTDATAGPDLSQASPAPLQPKRRRRRLKTILRSILMPPERAALYTTAQIPVAGDPTPPSQHYHYPHLPLCFMPLS